LGILETMFQIEPVAHIAEQVGSRRAEFPGLGEVLVGLGELALLREDNREALVRSTVSRILLDHRLVHLLRFFRLAAALAKPGDRHRLLRLLGEIRGSRQLRKLWKLAAAGEPGADHRDHPAAQRTRPCNRHALDPGLEESAAEATHAAKAAKAAKPTEA